MVGERGRRTAALKFQRLLVYDRRRRSFAVGFQVSLILRMHPLAAVLSIITLGHNQSDGLSLAPEDGTVEQ